MFSYVYIHGFNSGGSSRSGRELSRILVTPVFCPDCDYSLDFMSCLAEIQNLIAEKTAGAPLCVLGTSLGGFYALQLRMPQIRMVIAWNPVIYPAVQLAPLTGLNCRFTDGVEWSFGKKSLLSYAGAPDPREWQNAIWRRQGGSPQPKRHVILGEHDELLDSGLALAYWNGHEQIAHINAGHRIDDYSHVLQFLP